MKIPHCDREQEVVDALRSGRWMGAWGEEIRKHAEVCAVCAEVALITQEFQCEAELAQTELRRPDADLPSAGLVWWKAQLAARRAAEQRATAPIALVERAAIALGLFAAVLLAAWQWPHITAWLAESETPGSPSPFPAVPELFLHGEWLHWLEAAWPGQMPALLLAASAAAFLTLIVFAAYVVWRAD